MEIMEIFKTTGALLTGHFELSSGLHSDQYLQCALILQHPEHASCLSRDLAKRFEDDGISVVCGPALGGIIVSYEVARALGVRSIFCERREGRFILRRGFKVTPEDRVLVVEDVITTGRSVKEIIGVMQAEGARVVGVGAICDRSEKVIDFGRRLESLVRLQTKNLSPEDCPLCKKGLPIQKPGSRRPSV